MSSTYSGFMYYYHDNDTRGIQRPSWKIGNNGNPIDPATKYQALLLIQSNFTNGLNNKGNLEAVALSVDGSLAHFWMDSVSKRWNGPYDVGSF
jgi:hypothetical protein